MIIIYSIYDIDIKDILVLIKDTLLNVINELIERTVWLRKSMIL